MMLILMVPVKSADVKNFSEVLIVFVQAFRSFHPARPYVIVKFYKIIKYYHRFLTIS